MKSLLKYKSLISNMPFEEQCFTTKRSTWEKKIEKSVLDRLFGRRKSLTISRNDILQKCPIDDFVYLVIFWGYPRGMRGHKSDVEIFKRISEISEIVNNPMRGKQSAIEAQNTLEKLQTFQGLGISTISKLLYFRTHTFDGFQALILDERLMRVFNNNVFEEFSELENFRTDNASKKYLHYLKVMHRTAEQLTVTPEQLEMFLFVFGNNLK